MEKTLFDILISISEIINKHVEVKDILSRVLKIVSEFIDAKRLSIMLINNDFLELTTHEGFNVDKKKIKIPVGENICGTVAKTGHPLLVNNSPFIKEEFGYKTHSYLSVPIMTKDRIIGVLNITDKKGDYFDDDDLNLATFIASQCALAIDRYKMYKELLEQDRFSVVGKFTGAIAHDIKNLLNVINIYLDLIEIEEAKGENVQTYMANIRQEVELIEGYVSDILDFLKNEVFIKENEFSLSGLIKDLKTYMDIVTKNGNIKFNIDARFEGTIKADRKKLFRVIINILNNALKAARENGLIRMTIYKTYEHLIVNIFDNGKGIEEDKIKFIFDPFVSFSTTGTGLGLAVSKDIIRGHGGELKVSSKADRFTYFTIILPENRIL